MTTAERDAPGAASSQQPDSHQPDGDQPGVIGVFVAPEAGAPMEQRQWVEVVPGVGILGDRYATRRGHWSDPRWREQQLTIIEAETADDLGLEPRLLRRNLVTRGVQLQGLLGLEFRIGGARLAGMLPCDPCNYLQDLLQRPGLLRALVGRGGIRVRVLEGGRISTGDEIVVLGVHEPSLVFDDAADDDGADGGA